MSQAHCYQFAYCDVKGEVSPNNNVDWVSRKQFYQPNSKSSEQIWIIHLREAIMQSCVCRPHLDGTLPEYVISQEDNSPPESYIDFHQFFLLFLNINSPFDQVHSYQCMHIHLSPQHT